MLVHHRDLQNLLVHHRNLQNLLTTKYIKPLKKNQSPIIWSIHLWNHRLNAVKVKYSIWVDGQSHTQNYNQKCGRKFHFSVNFTYRRRYILWLANHDEYIWRGYCFIKSVRGFVIRMCFFFWLTLRERYTIWPDSNFI